MILAFKYKDILTAHVCVDEKGSIFVLTSLTNGIPYTHILVITKRQRHARILVEQYCDFLVQLNI